MNGIEFELISSSTSQWGSFFILAGLIGSLSAFLVQLVKPILRYEFNRTKFYSWPAGVQNILTEIVPLMSNNFHLPPSELLETRRKAVQLILSNPYGQYDLLVEIGKVAGENIEDVAGLARDIELYATPRHEGERESRRYAEAASRIASRTSLVMDVEDQFTLQVWKSILGKVTIVVNLVIAWIVFKQTGINGIQAVLLAVLGTAIAPVARDLVVAIENARQDLTRLKSRH